MLLTCVEIKIRTLGEQKKPQTEKDPTPTRARARARLAHIRMDGRVPDTPLPTPSSNPSRSRPRWKLTRMSCELKLCLLWEWE